jgi:hypothetical protein
VERVKRIALLPIAQAVTRAPEARWWTSPIAANSQQYVEWPGEHGGPPALTATATELATWRTATIEDEQSAQERPEDPSAPWSGHWWSALVPSRIPSTTRSNPGLGAVGLALVEDGFGQKNARCRPVSPRPGARIYEISSPEDWTELVGRYPIDVSNSRRHDWWRTTGWAGRWLTSGFRRRSADLDLLHIKSALAWGDGICLGSCPHQTEGTFQVNNTARRPKIMVSADGQGLVSQSGALLLGEAARVTGLGEALTAGLARWRAPRAVHDPGKIIADLVMALALGGDCLADIAVLRSLVHHPCAGGREAADAPEVPPGHCPARLTQLMSTVSSARPGGYPGVPAVDRAERHRAPISERTGSRVPAPHEGASPLGLAARRQACSLPELPFTKNPLVA